MELQFRIGLRLNRQCSGVGRKGASACGNNNCFSGGGKADDRVEVLTEFQVAVGSGFLLQALQEFCINVCAISQLCIYLKKIMSLNQVLEILTF
jgi:hypothetical protein